MKLNRMRDEVHYFLEELTYSIVAETGIPTDRYHLGKIILRSLKNAPDFVMQIDGGTGESDTFHSALVRSVRCAICLKKLGVKPNDTIVVMGPNSIDVPMPYYACLYLGAAMAGIDMTFKVAELEGAFEQCKPKVVFCQSRNALNVETALRSLKLDAYIITFSKILNFTSFREFLDQYSEDAMVHDFKPNDFDTRTTTALIASSSGSTGLPKLAKFNHDNIMIAFSDFLGMYSKFPTPFHLAIVHDLLHWITASYHFILSPILRYTRLQTSSKFTLEHGRYLINKYKPTFMLTNPIYMRALLNNHEDCDFSSLEHLNLVGSVTTTELLETIKRVIPNAVTQVGFGMTEACGFIFNYVGVNSDSVGTPMKRFEYKLVNYETGEEVTAPNIPGELWVKGRTIFKEYCNKPEETAATLTKDGWLKTGDILYRDENNYYYFVGRIKLLIKYCEFHIYPIQLEKVILSHPGVSEAAVVGISDHRFGELPRAFVVLKAGFKVTEDEIKNLVKDNLSDRKQLRGGVVFVNNIPKTTTGKIDRKELKKLVLTDLKN